MPRGAPGSRRQRRGLRPEWAEELGHLPAQREHDAPARLMSGCFPASRFLTGCFLTGCLLAGRLGLRVPSRCGAIGHYALPGLTTPDDAFTHVPGQVLRIQRTARSTAPEEPEFTLRRTSVNGAERLS